MYKDTIDTLSDAAKSKVEFLNNSLGKYLVSASLAGAYIGLAVVLSFSLGASFADVSSPLASLLVGLSFGIALVLIIFAGAELFTGNNLFFTMSSLSGATSWGDAAKNWFWCYIGNFIGASLFCVLILFSGIFSNISGDHFLMQVAANKMGLSTSELFFRGILCNWLVCLAIWCTLRTKNDAAKILMITWILLTFIISGYEHSIANMAILGLALIHPSPDTITLTGYFANLIPVTLGNIVGGTLFVGGLYWIISPVREKKEIAEEKLLVRKSVTSIK
ncbi:formate/nitrite transporter family protein [Evansella cellulosilytica]|uniref:Formate/nitrite transporter n=1 Tax=Evansella cellulosilytica (strain ATCC 21833 / DSM 2522 / FERM P-1141 / JCM 9156 / N-4) TaxID=649639 RepID=E6TW79_EVAC2|nr:formate/nitrite transporter family protein [Evansella cellulosilytica]ADU31035.1 formate/nitrite transporter [Evansella cellulosilytica DSM 2522]